MFSLVFCGTFFFFFLQPVSTELNEAIMPFGELWQGQETVFFFLEGGYHLVKGNKCLTITHF